MDAVRKLIFEKLAERGLNMKAASLRIGKSHSYLQQFLKRGIPVELGEHERAALAAVLGVPENELRGPSPKLSAKEYSKLSSPGLPIAEPYKPGPDHNSLDITPSARPLFGDRDLPVFGTAMGGSGGALVVTDRAVDWESRPDFLLRVEDAYGMIVSGDSMSPQFENGSTAIVNPHIPPRSGDTCIFRCHKDDGETLVMIKRLRRYTDDTWYVQQYNPQKDFTLKRSEWQICHVTVGNYFRR